MTPTARVEIKRGRALPLWLGHPWVYSGAIRQLHGSPAAGDVVEVVDESGRRIGEGFFNPVSQIRVRLVARAGEKLDDALLARRIHDAAALRRALLGLPREGTDAFRVVNAEGDGLPGLSVDHYAGVLVAQFGSVGLRRHAAAVWEALSAAWDPRALVELRATGAEAEGLGDEAAAAVVRGELPPEGVDVREGGLRWRVSPLGGQKTGWFCDQRENRRRFAAYARGRTVLDLYCYAGGFALTALGAGATAATLVDSSGRAVGRAREHAELNGFADRATCVEADVFRFLAAAAERGDRWEAVVLDPPKFARGRAGAEAAARGYRKLHGAALRVLAPGGVLATASCTTQARAAELARTLGEAAYDVGRAVTVLESAGAAPDHPVRLPCTEGDYLTFLVSRAD
jgi:23S rRNA (cytosine1962-C5)-methyltransferase